MLTSFPIVVPETRVATALRLLHEHRICALPVCEGGQLRGLVGEKALLRCTPSELTAPRFTEFRELLDNVPVSECVNASAVVTVSPETTVEEVAVLMARHALETIPVTLDGRPVGLVTWPFVLGALVHSGRRASALRREAPPQALTTEAPVSVDLSTFCVRDWMAGSFPTISRRTTVATAIHLMQSHRAPVLPVCERLEFLGFVDERTLLRLTPSVATAHTIPEIRCLLDRVAIGGMFVFAVSRVRPDTPLDEAAALMVMGAEEAIPVLDGGRLVGVLTWDRVLAAAAGQTPQIVFRGRQRALFWM